MTLVDASMLINHWRTPIPRLAALEAEDELLLHPWVLGELALGNLGQRRSAILQRLRLFQAAPVIEPADVLTLIEMHNLYGAGIGWVDAQLLASARIARAQLWTADGALGRAAQRLGVAFENRD